MADGAVLGAVVHWLGRRVELSRIVGEAVAEVARAMKAERGTFFLVEPGTGHLVSVAGHFPELPRIRLEPGQGIAGHVVGTGRAVVLPRVEDDPRFCAAVDLLTYLVGPAVPAALRLGSGPMICAECGEESDEMTTVREDGKKRVLCPECHEVWEEEQEVAQEAGRVMRGMMEYKG